MNQQLHIKLKEVRESKKMSQYAVSKAIGKKTMGHYHNIEKGLVVPKIDLVLKIAKVLNCSVEELYSLK